MPVDRPNVWSVAGTMPGLLAVVFMYWITQWTESDLSGGFYRSSIVCDPPTPDSHGLCPEGTVYRDGTCSPNPPGTDDWSGSKFCFDKDYVVKQGTALGGQVSTINTVGQILANIFVGSTLLDRCGRKLAMLLSLAGYGVSSAVWCLACLRVFSHDLQVAFLYIGVFAAAILNVFPAASMAMASDLSESDTVHLGLRLTALNVFKTAGVFIGFGAGFFILSVDLEDYLMVWLGFTIIASCFVLFSYAVLRETLPSRDIDASTRGLARNAARSNGSLQAPERGSCCCLALGEIRSAFQIVWQDPFLRYNMLFLVVLSAAGCYGVIGIAPSWAISICGYTQAVASLSGIVQQIAIIFGSVVSSIGLRAIGAYQTNFLGIFIAAISFFIVGMGAYYKENAALLFWLGWFFAGIGFGIMTPCSFAITSVRVERHAQGKVFACQNVSTLIGISIGTLVFTNCLFSNGATDSSWQLARSWFVASLLMVVTLVGAVSLYLVYIVPEISSTVDSLIQVEPGRAVS